MTKIKICGITNQEDARKAAELGADAIGFIFFKKSPRSVDREAVREIIAGLPPFVAKVGVFADEEEDVVREIQSYCGLTALQFHGNETKEYCSRFSNVIKAFRIKDKRDLERVKEYEPHVNAILLDTYSRDKVGGTGKSFDWGVLEGFRAKKPLILSGGITEKNAGQALSAIKPYAIDSASGTESQPGKKDCMKMKNLINIVKGDDSI